MIQLIRGFKDILQPEASLWQHIENEARRLFESHGYREIRLPILEKTELFARSIGETTDIVEKEMYTFEDRSGDHLTLRPEATASVVRAYIQHKLSGTEPIRKLYTIGPMFRRERPQKGRYRQFYQIDAEVFGISSPYADAQMILMLAKLMERLGVTGISAHINSLGCPECRPPYRENLKAFIQQHTEELCEDCLRRKDKNPLRVLDCKNESCRKAMTEAPELLDQLCTPCADHFALVRRELDRRDLDYKINKRLVRGLDYYTRTAFELQTDMLGAQSAVAGGGRYDGLVKTLGGPDIPAIGFAIGFDRLVEVITQAKPPETPAPSVFFIPMGEIAMEKAFDFCLQLAEKNIEADTDYSGRSLKALMKRADRLAAPLVVIMGDNELKAGEVSLKNMTTGEQRPVPLDSLVEILSLEISAQAQAE
ncbi:histidine--tRNA ligase [Desulfobotulus mexicanus]|uniref:Histidine--tRNA ligase n=1 Tax=Desulfobotulus mexicanus TaxID=2586642 RepID=A0A5S5MDL9_9BACT|nr:histidine--tRNA ligase [Desulfobotulus mexicanus]TYT73794.1 histidine--tRNA ligase [Desulfobotulus mexicanus]